jgi:pyruvate dehydrogenase E1 component alpha subunit
MTKQELIDFERGIAALYDAGELPYLVHLSGGNEEQLLEVFSEVRPGDYVFSTHRNHYHALLHGVPPEALEADIRAGRSMFVFDRARNFLSFSIVAAGPSIAAGVAWALKRKGSDKRVWCFIGDGAEDEGHFYEAVRFVDGHELPCTFVVEDNDRSVTAGCHERRGKDEGFPWPPCVRSYRYTPTWPHSGTGTPGWLKFKREAEVVADPRRAGMSGGVTPVYQDAKGAYLVAVKESNERLASFGTVFVGYNVRHGSAYGTLRDVPEEQRIETPLAENLMLGLGMDAADAMVNTLDVIETISGGEFRMPVIIRAVAGSVKPFYAGLTHSRNLASAVRGLVHFPVLEPGHSLEVMFAYELALASAGPMLISERKELF